MGLTKKITNKSNIIFKEFKDIPESRSIPTAKKKTPSVSMILQACILKKKSGIRIIPMAPVNIKIEPSIKKKELNKLIKSNALISRFVIGRAKVT